MNKILPNLMRSLLLLILGCSGCAGHVLSVDSHNATEESSEGLTMNELAGTWEYTEESGILYQLVFDQKGQGTYDWQEGTFETTSLSDRRWVGKWHQSGNDREGGFEALLSEDYRSATGHWWYTRIGENVEPTRPGANFTLIRQTRLVCTKNVC